MNICASERLEGRKHKERQGVDLPVLFLSLLLGVLLFCCLSVDLSPAP